MYSNMLELQAARGGGARAEEPGGVRQAGLQTRFEIDRIRIRTF